MPSFSSAAALHRGRVRTRNEDSVVVSETLIAVADGLGGHPAGDLASRITVERLADLGAQEQRCVPDVIAAIEDANRLILAAGAAEAQRSGMGSTLCGVILVSVDGVWECAVFNVGDSRVYNLRDGALRQVSVDHSEVQELQEAGLLSPVAALNYPRRNIITRCLGTDPAPEPDLWLVPIATGERYLACSDGLTNEVDDLTIAALLIEHREPETAAHALLEAALAAGGRDNVAIAVADLEV